MLTRNLRDHPAAKAPSLSHPRARGRRPRAARLRRGHAGGVARAWLGLKAPEGHLYHHVHADRVLGLPGLLLSLGFSGKGADEPLTVYGSPPRGGAAGVTRRGTSPALPLARGHALRRRGLPFSRA